MTRTGLGFGVLLLAFGCGGVTAAPVDGGGDAAVEVIPARGGAGGDGTAGVGGTAGGEGGAAGASCTPATVQLTAGTVACACGGSCAPCPTADGPTCGGTGLGHPNWRGCTVGGAPYVGCALVPSDGGAAALGYCCANDCSAAPCATALP